MMFTEHSLHVLFSLPVIYHNSQVTKSIGTKKMNKLNKLMPSF